MFDFKQFVVNMFDMKMKYTETLKNWKQNKLTYILKYKLTREFHFNQNINLLFSKFIVKLMKIQI